MLPEETSFVWTDAAWRAEAEHWILERVADLGLEPSGTIEQPHVRPWGTVLRIPTSGGTLWFKASTRPLAYEIPLLEELGRRAPDRVPRLLAADRERAWMLLEDAGTPVTELHPDGPPVHVWEEFVGTYAELQVDAAPAAERLLAEGVPDRRLPHLVDRFLPVLEDERLVRPRGRGVSDGELRRLRALEPALRDAVATVVALDLPDSVQHDDLHAWNVCVDHSGYRFIDWGDACISQPLLSLYVPLVRVPPEGAAAARDAYLEPWTAFRPHGELAAAADAAVLLAQLTGVLKWARINSGLTDEERIGCEDVIPKRLWYLLELACG